MALTIFDSVDSWLSIIDYRKGGSCIRPFNLKICTTLSDNQSNAYTRRRLKGIAMRTIWWNRGKVVLIDQTKLPLKEEYIETDDYHRVAKAIKVLSVRGAPAIGVAAAYGMVLAAQQSSAKSTSEFLKELEKAAQVLGATRPTAVNLFWALERMKKKAYANEHLSVSRLKRVLKEEAEAIAEEELAMSKRMGEYGAKLVKSGDNILHH